MILKLNKLLKLIIEKNWFLFWFQYLVVDTQMMMGGKHKYSLSPEEYIFAALNLYLDIINLFLFILTIIGAVRDWGNGGIRYQICSLFHQSRFNESRFDEHTIVMKFRLATKFRRQPD